MAADPTARALQSIDARIKGEELSSRVAAAQAMLGTLTADLESLDAASSIELDSLTALVTALKKCTLAADCVVVDKRLSSMNMAPVSKQRAPLRMITDDNQKAKVSIKLSKPTRPKPAPAKKADVPRPAVQQPPPVTPQPATMPRMARLLVVVDTNELLDTSTPIDRAFLLQDCAGCDVMLPSVVTHELDGLKKNSDAALARQARQANALLSHAAVTREPWLLCEPETARTGDRELTADARVLRCARDYAPSVKLHPSDRVLLATSDRNLLLRAATAGVEAMSLAEAHALARSRHDAWRAAYGTCSHAQDAAANAVEAARWASGKTVTSAFSEVGFG